MDNQQPNFKNICKNAQKHIIVSGNIYGAYLTLQEIDTFNKKGIKRMWKVRHVITEKETVMTPWYLIRIDKKYKEKLSCGNFQNGLKNYLYSNSKNNAIKRKHPFNLSKSEFENLINKSCFYCGDLPVKSSNNSLISRGNINEPPLFYNGIDRLDSEKGYSLQNCVSCCSKCNYMKNVFSVNDFYKQIEKIYNFSIIKIGSTTIAKASTSQANGGGNGETLTMKDEEEDIV